MPMKKTLQTASTVEPVKMTEPYGQTDRKTSEHTAGTT